MSNRNITMLVISIFAILFLLAFCGLMIIKGNSTYILIAVVLVVYLGYTIVQLLNQNKIYCQDKEEGLREGILEFRRLTIVGHSSKHESANPNFAVGLFKVCKLEGDDNHMVLGKWISLSGDFRKLKLEKHKKYRAGFYLNSRQLVYINIENHTTK